MSNYLKPLYTSFEQAYQQAVGTSQIQMVEFSGFIMEIYTFSQYSILCDIIFNNVINPSGSITIELANYSTQVYLNDMIFYPSNNIQIVALNEVNLVINTDKLINLNGVIKIGGY